jgi:hypothetical protein
MNRNVIRLAVATALVAGFSVSAYAGDGDLPNSGTSDLWVFVTDPATSQTFALDTDETVTSLVPTSPTATGGTTAVPVTTGAFSITSSALASFISGSTDESALQVAFLAANYNTASPSNSANQTAGKEWVIESDNGLVSKTTGLNFNSMSVIAGGFNGDATYLTQTATNTYNSGGTAFPWSDGTATGSVFNPNVTGNAGGSSSLYGQGASQLGVGLGQNVPLYAITGGNGTSNVFAYLLGNASVSLTGVVSDVAPVPLPAAVWLFGSGLLGLVGVGRRRAA